MINLKKTRIITTKDSKSQKSCLRKKSENVNFINVLINYKSLKKYEEFNHIQAECNSILETSLTRKNQICKGFYSQI